MFPSRSAPIAILLATLTAPLPAGEVSRWTFDDTLQDSVGNNDGSYGGGPAPSFVTGQDGTVEGALSFNGVAGLAERVALPEGAGLPIAANLRYSVAAWVRGNRGANQVLYSESNAGDSSIVLQIGFDPSGATGRAHVILRNGGAAALIDTVLSTTNVLDGTWHHLVWVDDNGSGRLYVDGAVEGQVDYTRPALTLERITIGATQGALGYSSFLKAAVDDVRVFNHALSNQEVQDAFFPVVCPAAVFTNAAPTIISTTGGEEVEYTGRGFAAGHIAYLGEELLIDQTITFSGLDATITGTTPPLPEGDYRPGVRCANGETAAVWSGLISVVAPPAPAINAVAPRNVSTVGGETIDVNGHNFTETMELELLDAAGATTLPFTLLNRGNLTFITPAHAEGVVDLRVTVAGAAPAVYRGALNYVLIYPEVRSITPDALPAYFSGANVVVDGVNFTRDMELWLADAAGTITPLAFAYESAFRVYFFAPSRGPGVLDLVVRAGTTPASTLRGALTYLPLPRPTISAVVPRTVTTAGGDVVRVNGTAFHETMEVAIVDDAGTTVLSFTYIGTSLLSFVAPPHAAGRVDLSLSVEGQPPFVMADAIEYVPGTGPEITSFAPTHADARGGAELVVRGRNFTATTELVILDVDAGGLDYEEIQSDFINDTLMTAVLPAHEPGQVRVGARPGGAVDPVFAQGLLEFVDPAAPAPEEIEATLVAGIAELEWVNPVPYARVHVYRDGQFHRTLEGSAAFFRDPEAVGGNQVEYGLVGEVAGGGSGVALMRVAKMLCKPPATFGEGTPGEKNFRVYGGHLPLVEPLGLGLEAPAPGGAVEPVIGDGGYQFVVIEPSSGQPIINHDLAQLRRVLAPNELVTGFRLLETTTKLRIGVHAARIAAGDNLSLRVLIEPAEPGISWDPAELTLPNVPVEPDHAWIVVDYNTQNPPPPGSPVPDPDPEDQLPPHDPMPPGAYLLRVYAVGGLLGQAHYEVSSDRSDEQIPVPAAGCPPYPLVRVEPASNFNPTIHAIRQVGSSQEFGIPIIDSDGNVIPLVKATLEAEVTDLDGDPIVKYIWDVHNGLEVKHKESASNKFELTFYGYGTFAATLKVWDNRCGTTTETGIPVTIRPPCVPIANSPNFTYPTPVPSTLHFVTGLASLDEFEDELTQTFRAFVVDEIAGPDCQGGAATTHRVQMGLFRAGGPSSLTSGGQGNNEVQVEEAHLQGVANGRECLVAELTSEPGEGLDADGNECSFEHLIGGRFWVVRFDMKTLPPVNPGVPGAEGVYELWARGSDNPQGNGPWSPWRRVQTIQKQEVISNGTPITIWVPIAGSQSVNVYDPPAILADAPYTAASYDARSRTYDFTASLAPPGTGSGVHSSDEVPLESDEIEDLQGQFPSSDNGLESAEQTVFLAFTKGHWEVDRVRTGYEVYVLGKKSYNRTDVLGHQIPAQQLGGGGGGSVCSLLPPYGDCSFESLVNEGFETPLFDVPLFVDPLTGGAIFSMSFATSVGGIIDVSLGHEMRLEACPQGNDPAFDAYFWFNTIGALYFGAEIDMDFVLGIVSTDFGIDVGLEGKLPVIMDVVNLGAPQFAFLLSLYVEAWFEICGLWIFCHEERERLADETILRVPDNSQTEALVNGIAGQIASAKAACSGSNLVRGAEGAGGGAQVQINAPSRQLSITTSPNGFRQVAVGRGDSGRLFYLLKGTLADWQWPPADVVLPTAQTSEYSGTQANPKVVFMDNNRVLLAWTQSFANEDQALAGIQEEDLADPLIFNAVSRRSEIVFSIGTWSFLPNPEPDKPLIPYISWSTAQRLPNDQSPNGWRADGMVSLALDPTTVNGPFGPGVWATWVRYETPDMVQLDGEGVARVQMRQTSIYARQIFTAFAAPRVKISGSADEIDIEPDVAVAPDGTTFIVWVNDPVHDDLVAENTGREILYSVHLGNNAFSAPAPVLADPSPFRGLLEPDIALGANGHGLLVFTALPANAETTDAGIGSARVLYSVAITDADTTPQFGNPVLVGLKCDTPIHAHAPEIHIFHPGLGGDDDTRFILTFQERGSVGSRAGAGNAIAVVYNDRLARWGDPVNLTPDDRVHQGIAATVTSAGEIVLMHQSPYPASRDLALTEALRRGQGGGIAGDPTPEPIFGGQLFGDLMGQSFPAVADPAIGACRVSDLHAAPGSDLTATVHVSNRGFGPTPDGLTLTLTQEIDGAREPIHEASLSPIEPGDEAVFEVPITMPRRPALLIVSVEGVEGELNPADNERVCPLGAQKPRDLSGELTFVQGEPAVVLRWTNGGIYDGVQIYRDGQMLAEVPGTRRFFVDSGLVGIDPRSGQVDSHEYCVRGSILLSQSEKSEPITVPLSTPPSRFIRADANADGETNISDPVFTLNFLFLGGRPPACIAATDANADGDTNLSDPIYTLNHLFLGGPPPRAPYPACGTAPEPDGLGCESSACDG